MTPAELAKYSAISFECKKDGLRQTQAGTWKVAFTLQGIDMDERLTKAVPGTRYMMVLVEIDDLELPVHQPAKEISTLATPEAASDKPPFPVKRGKIDWRDMPPAKQAGIRCDDAVFAAFLLEEYGFDTNGAEQAAIVVRQLCKVESRREFNADPLAKARWQGLDDQFQAWKAHENA